MTFFSRKAEESYFKKGTCSQDEHGGTQQEPITKRQPCSQGPTSRSGKRVGEDPGNEFLFFVVTSVELVN